MIKDNNKGQQEEQAMPFASLLIGPSPGDRETAMPRTRDDYLMTTNGMTGVK